MNIVFDKNWFKKHQSKLLWLLSWKFFRKALGIQINEKITEINSSNFSYGDRYFEKEGELFVERTTEFLSGDLISNRLYFAFKPFWYILHFTDWAMLDRVEMMTKFSFGFSTLTVYPQSIGANNPVSGYAGRDSDQVFATLRAGAGTASSTTTLDPRLDASTTSNQYATIRRGINCFDTSSLTAGVTITNVVLSFLSNSKASGLGSPDIHAAGSTPAATNAIANADYGQVQTTSFGSIAYASIVADSATANSITLNASGISNVSKTGISKFSLQTSWDILNDLTGATWASSAFSRVSMINDSSTSPKLVVTYSAVSGPANLKSYNTNVKANIKSIDTNLIANIKSLDTNV